MTPARGTSFFLPLTLRRVAHTEARARSTQRPRSGSTTVTATAAHAHLLPSMLCLRVCCLPFQRIAPVLATIVRASPLTFLPFVLPPSSLPSLVAHPIRVASPEQDRISDSDFICPSIEGYCRTPSLAPCSPPPASSLLLFLDRLLRHPKPSFLFPFRSFQPLRSCPGVRLAPPARAPVPHPSSRRRSRLLLPLPPRLPGLRPQASLARGRSPPRPSSVHSSKRRRRGSARKPAMGCRPGRRPQRPGSEWRSNMTWKENTTTNNPRKQKQPTTRPHSPSQSK